MRGKRNFPKNSNAIFPFPHETKKYIFDEIPRRKDIKWHATRSFSSNGLEDDLSRSRKKLRNKAAAACVPCDELISSNVAGTSWMRENWCASRFRIIARRYTARVRASREITLSAQLPRLDSVLRELRLSTRSCKNSSPPSQILARVNFLPRFENWSISFSRSKFSIIRRNSLHTRFFPERIRIFQLAIEKYNFEWM